MGVLVLGHVKCEALLPLWRSGCYSLGDVSVEGLGPHDSQGGMRRHVAGAPLLRYFARAQHPSPTPGSVGERVFRVCTADELSRLWEGRRGWGPLAADRAQLSTALRAVALVTCTPLAESTLPAKPAGPPLAANERVLRSDVLHAGSVRTPTPLGAIRHMAAAAHRPGGGKSGRRPAGVGAPPPSLPSPSKGRVRRGGDAALPGFEHRPCKLTIISGAPLGTPGRQLLVRWEPDALASRAELALLVESGYVLVWEQPTPGGGILAQFADSWETEATCGTDALDAYDGAAAEPPLWLRAGRGGSLAGPLLRDPTERVTPYGRDYPLDIHTGPCHPDRDVQGTGAYGVTSYGDNLFGVYDPEGNVRCPITGGRLALLAEWHSRANGCDIGGADFAMSAYACIAHYSSKSLKLSNHWATPPRLVAALRAAAYATTERFSSPVNAHGGFARRYTYRAGDKSFGAEYDAYSKRFSGSWYMNPEYDAEELTRALRWAIASAADDGGPNLGLAVLPRYAKAGHTALLGTRGCHVLCTMPQGFRFTPQDAWTGTRDTSTGARFPVDIAVVYNEKGRLEFGSGLAAGSPLESLLREEFGLVGAFSPPPPLPDVGVGSRRAVPQLRRWPPGLREAPREDCLEGAPPPLELPTGAALAWLDSIPCLGRRWSGLGRTLVFADGSHTRGSARAGAGVWTPFSGDPPAAPGPGSSLPAPDAAAAGPWAPDVARPLGRWEGYTFTGVQNSVRAELVAIREAIRAHPGEGELVLFTDCLSALCMIRRWWFSPNTMLLHHERPLVEGITSEIFRRSGLVRLVKVRSHVGIPGNEVADTIAAWAASSDGAVRLDDTGSTHPRGIGLATSWEAIGHDDPASPSPADPPRPRRQLPPHPSGQPRAAERYDMYNSQAALRRIADRVMTVRAAQRAKGYAQAMGEDPLSHGPYSLLPAESNALWRLLPDTTLRACLKVRSNQFFAGAPAAAAGFAPTPYCTICLDRDEHDGWKHSLTRCMHPAVHGMRCLRHNEIVRVMVDTIAHGRRGNSDIRSDLRPEPAQTDLWGPDTAGADAPEGPQTMPCPLTQAALHGFEEPRAVPRTGAPLTHGAYDLSLEDPPEGTGPASDRFLAGLGGPNTRVLVGAELWEDLPSLDYDPEVEGVGTLAFSGRQSRTVPSWALRTSLTPDLVVIEGVSEDSVPAPTDPGVSFTLVDITLSAEHRLEEAANLKREKYLALGVALSRAGWRVKPFVTLAFGVRGGVPRASLAALTALGVNPAPARAALTRAHAIACLSLRRILHFKRRVEACLLGPCEGRPERIRAHRRSGGSFRLAAGPEVGTTRPPGGPGHAPPRPQLPPWGGRAAGLLGPRGGG